MTITDLIADLRSRINPAYAHTLGTESYERRMCAEALEAQQAEIEQLMYALENSADAASKAMNKAWQLGQKYWSQADSDYASQWKKADKTQAAFQSLVEETRAAIDRMVGECRKGGGDE